MTPNLVYKCPSDRGLTDLELNLIAEQGWFDWKREHPKAEEGDEWKE